MHKRSPEIEAKDFVAKFKDQDERACGIIAGALIDEQLLRRLSSHLAPIPSGRDDFLGPDDARAPIGTFSARIDLAYRTGLISAHLCRDIHLIRKIRNEFAHNSETATFETSPVSDYLHCLAASFRHLDISRYSPKDLFVFIVGILIFFRFFTRICGRQPAPVRRPGYGRGRFRAL
jgi:hypothetical protein